MKLRWRFFLWLFAICLLPFSVVVLSLIQYRASTKQRIEELHGLLADKAARETASYLESLNRRLAFTSEVERNLRLKDETRLALILQKVLETNKDFVKVSIINPQGKEELAFSAFKRVSPGGFKIDIEALEETLQKKAVVLKGPNVYLGGIPCLDVYYPVGFKRVLLVTASMESLVAAFKRHKTPRVPRSLPGFPLMEGLVSTFKRHETGATRGISLVGEDGAALPGFVSLPVSGPLARRIAGAGPSTLLEGVRSTSRAGGAYRKKEGGKAWIGVSRRVEGLPWAVVTFQDEDEAYLSYRNLKRQMLAWVFLAAMLALAGATYLSQKIMSPLSELSGGARRVRDRDFSKPVPEKGWPELEYLSQTFNSMARDLKRYLDLQVDRLVAEKAKVETLIYSIPEGIVMADAKGGVLYVNHPAFSMLGIPETDLTVATRQVGDIIRQKELITLIKKILLEGRDFAEGQLKLETAPSGGASVTRYFKTVARPVTPPPSAGRQGPALGVVLILRDITLEKEIETMKEQFLHSITHDLRNPMTGIRGFTEIVERRREPLDSHEATCFNMIYRNINSLESMVDDILDLARLRSKKMPVFFEEIDLPPFLAPLVATHKPQFGDNQVELQTKIPPASCIIKADPKLVERLLNNLLGNAVKYTSQGGNVVLELKPHKERVELVVSDTGRGVPEDKLESLFKEFEQVRLEDRKVGYGLGLSICKHIAELHGGDIRAESREGSGTRFVVTLPRTPPTA